MAALAGLPVPRMDWSSTDAPQALKKFKSLCQLYFAGPLKDKSEELITQRTLQAVPFPRSEHNWANDPGSPYL